MAVSDIEAQAVLEFLRENGLSQSESAFMEDILDSSELCSFHFEKFVFPILPPPPPPPLKIPRPPFASAVAAVADSGSNNSPCSSSSSQEFVSLDSSTSDVCSSEFTNPYGIRTGKRAQSEASSDRLSQFGTARDYPDFEMQNELCAYTEKDEDYAVPPSFANLDTFGGPTEDKFVMTQETDKQLEKQLDFNLLPVGFQSVNQSNYVDKLWPFRVTSKEDVANYSNLNKNVQTLVVGEDKEGGKLYGCSAPICWCSAEGQGPYGDGHIDYGKNFEMYEFQSKPTVENSAECDSGLGLNNHKNQTYIVKKTPPYDLVGDLKSTSDSCADVVKKNFHASNENGKYEYEFDGEVAKKSSGPDVADYGGDVAADELLICNPFENEYEVFDLRIIHRKSRTGFEENREFPIVLNSIIAGRYYVTEYLGSAAFSNVVQAQDLQTGADVCLKIVKNDKDFFDQSLDEIKLLKFVNKYDPGDERHILRLYDYFYYQEHLFIVCELLRANLYEFQKYNRESGGVPYFTLSRLQVIARQCLEALEYLHDLRIIHCDLKPENILIKSYRRCEIKVIDLGSSCFQTDNLCLYVQSRSYRAPEVILGLPYDQKIDLWSLGCILAELYSGEVLFPNEAVVMLLARMIGLLGPIDMEMLTMGQETHKYFTQDYDLFHISEESNQLEYIIPEESSLEHHLEVSDDAFLDFLRNLLEINPQRRPSAREALEHRWLSHSYECNTS